MGKLCHKKPKDCREQLLLFNTSLLRTQRLDMVDGGGVVAVHRLRESQLLLLLLRRRQVGSPKRLARAVGADLLVFVDFDLIVVVVIIIVFVVLCINWEVSWRKRLR